MKSIIYFIALFSLFTQNSFSQDDELITKYTILKNQENNISYVKEIAHINCGSNDQDYELDGNSEDIGRVHCSLDYIQASGNGDTQYSNHRWFSYSANIINTTNDLLLVINDADNKTRHYNIIINDIYSFEIMHYAETSKDKAGEWKKILIKIPSFMIKNGKNIFRFDHRNMTDYPPAISDIWIYEILN